MPTTPRDALSSPLFASGSLARRIERAEACLIADGAAAAARRLPPGQVEADPLAGGVAVYIEPGSPYNKVAGLGFEGLPDESAIDGLERRFRERAAPLQVELSALGLPDVARFFTRRGYELVNFENVLGLPLGDGLPAAVTTSADPQISISEVGPDENAVWLDAVTDGFLQPDTFDGPSSHETVDRDLFERIFSDVAAAPAFDRFLARRDGQPAGGASVRFSEGIALLCGAATVPAHRRRGVQTALLRHRLQLAAARGCDLAVVTTQPGSKSQQNVQRFGFSLLYTRAILLKEP